MINVFKKRTRLYALTASALFLLQGVDASIASGAAPGGVGVGGVPGAGVPGVPGVGGLGAGGVPSGVGGSANACNVADNRDDRNPLSPIVCSDRQKHSINNSTVVVKKKGDTAVTAGWIGVEGEDDVAGSEEATKPTIIELNSSSLKNEPGAEIVSVKGPQYGSAVFASQDGVVKLQNSSIRDFDTGLYALFGGKAIIQGGTISSVIVGVEAAHESLILLNNTAITVSGPQEGGNEDEKEVMGLRAGNGTVIDMKLGKVIVPTGRSVVVAENGGIVQLDKVNVTIDSSQSGAAAQALSSFLFTDAGFISFKNGNINHSHSVGVWVFDNDDEDSNNVQRHNDTRVRRIEIDDPSSEFLASSVYASYLIPQILGQETRTGVGEERTDEVDFRIRASVQSSTINLSGEASTGVYFDNQSDNLEQSRLKSNQLQNKESLVFLHGTTLKVPDGTAILGKNMRGSVLIDGASQVSGNSFLRAEATSEVSVFINDSIVGGEAYVERGSQGKIFLFNQSQWHVTKSKFGNPQNRGCEDSCVSFVKLNNSAIGLLPLVDENQRNYSYPMLRIGNGEGTVYTASGDSYIYVLAFMQADASEDSQLSGRLLIHGNVAGQTKVHVLTMKPNAEGRQGRSAKAYKPQSISIIQVYGEASEDSFKLNGEYATIGGLPYQYVLRAYGPAIPSKMQYFDKTLLKKSRSVWDFRLEDKNLPYERNSLSFVGDNRERARVNTSSVPSRETVRSEVDNSTVGSNLPSGTSEVRLPNQVIASDANGTSALLRSSETGDEDHTDGGYDRYVEIEESEAVTSIPSPTTSPVISTVSEGREATDQGSAGTSAAVTSLPAPTTSPVASTVSEGREATDQGSAGTSAAVTSLPSSTTSSVTSTVSEGGASTDPRRAGTSAAVTSLPSSTTSPVASAASQEGASTDPARSGTSEYGVYTVSSNSSPSSKGRSSLNLISLGADSAARSDRGGISVISTDGVSVSSGHTISNKIPSIKSAASIKPSSEVSVKPVASSSGAAGRVLLLNNSGKETVSSTCDATQDNGEKGAQNPYSCSDGKSHTVTNLTLKAKDKTQHSMHAQNENTVIKLENATIMGGGDNKSNVDLTKLQAVSAVFAEDNAKVVLEKNSTITSSVIGLEAQDGGKVMMTGGSVNAHYVGALAGSGSSVNLTDTRINVTGDLAVAGLVSQAGKVSMDSGAITLAKGVAVRSEFGGSVELDKVSITAKKGQGKLDSADNFGRAAFLLSDNASVDFKNGNVVTDAHALWIMKSDDNVVETGSSRRRRSSEVRPTMNHANIESSTVTVEGDGTYGIYFDGGIQKEASQQNRSEDLATEKAIVAKRSAESKQEKTPISITGTVSLKKTDFEVASGIAIYGNNSGGHVSLENKTTLVGDLLLKADNDSNISVLVDSSIVKGDVRVDKSSYAKLDLINQSEWILKRSAQGNLGTPNLGCVDSCISSVSLVNSTIDFASSESEGKYQTLRIGNGKGIVYAAQGNAAIHLNARLNPRDPSNQQVTDRLVIHGDVSGKTKIHVRGDAGNVGDGQANAKIAHTVSIIQVYGQAKKDSFQLDGNYVALRNSPYKYTLHAYAPKATSKQEHVQQKFVKDGGEFWNFRLENQYVKSVGSADLSEQFVRSVVPQVPTYLVLPNSVFHAGLMDISNQNKQLETLRMTSTGMVEVRENPALYLRGYGGSYRYASDLSALEYGYGGDLSYNGVEAGVLLQTIENTDSAISFGVMGTYGKLSLQPLNVEQSQKSAFDKWTATVYGSMQHNAGFYVDGLLSYGLFKGDVLTLARGKTATLKGNPLSVSLAGGQTIATGYKGFVFDPQVQVVYQHLQFNKARDIDNFDIEMGNLNQWVARVGGRLTKIPTGSEGVNAVAFYGKLYLAHGFEGKQSVHFNDAFKLGAFGSSLEAGLGFNAKLLPQFSLHADILYQHKLNKAGFSGTSFSGGVRYQF
ncbi:autotransporter outer membrane beta-barrel domain-containing protein [Bartonella sp. MU37NMGALS]|uniref:autotransporter outer membrane beta-barrel domain-containing protein n=1 Tax=Bartonella sp. MU37NMGALS TaxID=3243560 RepID=UPI0035CE9093